MKTNIFKPKTVAAILCVAFLFGSVATDAQRRTTGTRSDEVSRSGVTKSKELVNEIRRKGQTDKSNKPVNSQLKSVRVKGNSQRTEGYRSSNRVSQQSSASRGESSGYHRSEQVRGKQRGDRAQAKYEAKHEARSYHRVKPVHEYQHHRTNWWHEHCRPAAIKSHPSSYKASRHYWEHEWEQYRWNRDSWRHYYREMHPYAFRYHPGYYYHPRYGHVVRYFEVEPVVFIHDHHRYYCWDGNFFRYKPGVGYVWVEIPYGFRFEAVLADYDRVRINGHFYLRVGNVFIEAAYDGFRLVHYPGRYLAWND